MQSSPCPLLEEPPAWRGALSVLWIWVHTGMWLLLVAVCLVLVVQTLQMAGQAAL